MHRMLLGTMLWLSVMSLAVADTTGSMGGSPVGDRSRLDPATTMTAAAGRTCKSVSSCREAVELWCGGYSRADGDGDGIPCENVCRSRRQVDAIRAEIGC